MDASPTPTVVPDARSWLATSVEASAVAAADAAFADLASGDAADLITHIEDRGLAPLLAWTDLFARTGLDREPWAREAALRAVRAYASRLAELMASAAEGGRA